MGQADAAHCSMHVIIDMIHSSVGFKTFSLSIPTATEGVPQELLKPSMVWPNKEAFWQVVGMFQKDVMEAVQLAGPCIA